MYCMVWVTIILTSSNKQLKKADINNHWCTEADIEKLAGRNDLRNGILII